jgi:pullulanase/glycogen debranching enzyme
MHIDGFRFDLASLLAKVKGTYNHQSLLFEAINNESLL